MQDDDLDPKDKELEEVNDEEVDDLDDDLILGKNKAKKPLVEEDSLDTLADEEEEVLPEDSFDDVDLW